MRLILWCIAVIILSITLVSCGVPSVAISNTPTINTPSATVVVFHPSATPTPYPWPISTPAKPIFFVDYYAAGDMGYGLYDALMNPVEMPKIIIYADGQTLVRDGSWYSETRLSQNQMCSLRSRIITENSMPQASTPSSDVVVPHTVAISGANLTRSDFSSDLLGNDIVYQPFVSDRILVWAVRLQKRTSSVMGLRFWSNSSLPPLDKLLHGSTEGIFFWQGEMAKQILNFYGFNADPPQLLLVTDYEEGEFAIIVRPLLPHETAQQFESWPFTTNMNPVNYSDLPFQCEN